MKCSFVKFLILMAIFASGTASSQVANFSPPDLQKIDVVEKPGHHIPLDLTFQNDHGEVVPLSDYFHQDKPVVIVLAYYNCPMLCTLVLNGLTEAARQIRFSPGTDYTILTISIDPRETVELAAAKKENYVQSFGNENAAAGWSWFVGKEDQSKELADSLGFVYYYDKEKDQYAHPAVLHILTADGKISRYLYGIEFKPKDLELALLEASAGKIGNTVDRLVLYCFHYDPDAKGYVIVAENIMKIGGALTVVLLSFFVAALWIRNKTKGS